MLLWFLKQPKIEKFNNILIPIIFNTEQKWLIDIHLNRMIDLPGI